ncbi:DoxX family protein [Ferruginibacter profundus]
MQISNYKWVRELGCFLLVLLFMYTGTSKLIGYQLFREQLSQISYLKAFSQPLSILLPILELTTGLTIIFKPTQKYGLYAAAILMTLFTFYVALMLLSDSTKLPCSCGGVIKTMSWKQHLYFNIFFMVLAWFTIKIRVSEKRE